MKTVSAYHALLMLLYRILVQYLESRGRVLPVPVLSDLQVIELDTMELKKYVETLRSSMYS